MVSSTPQQQQQNAQASSPAADMEALKQQAKKLALGDAPSVQASDSASAQTNGVNGVHHAQNGYEASTPRPSNADQDAALHPSTERGSPLANGSSEHAPAYSQTGDFVGPGPEQVTANPSNPSLPPPSVAKSIPCRFYPNCRYGDSCAFAHGAENMNGPGPEGVPNGAVFGGPSPDHPMPFFNPYAPSPQPGMPPMDYYGAPVGPGYYGPPPPAAYQPNPYAPMPYYGGYYPGPPPPQNGSAPMTDGAPTPSPPVAPPQGLPSAELNGSAPADPTASSQAAPPASSSVVSPETPAFVPMSSSVHEQAQQVTALPHPSAFPHPVQQSAASQNGFDPASRPARNGNNPALNGGSATATKRERGPYASSARTSIKGGSSKKPFQIACTFFLNNACRLGDACQFSHVLQDGTDAKSQGRNIVGVDGRVGEMAVLEEFKRTESLRKERMAASGAIPQRPRPDSVPRPHGANQQHHNLPPHPARYTNGHANEGSGLPGVDGHYNGSASGNGYHKKPFHGNSNNNNRGRHLHQSAPAPRIPSGEDFPALPVGASSPRNPSPDAAKMDASSLAENNNSSNLSTPASTDGEAQSGQSTPLTTASTHDAAAAVNVLPKLVSSFASAAARGASAAPPPPRNPPRGGKQQQNKSAKATAAPATPSTPVESAVASPQPAQVPEAVAA